MTSMKKNTKIKLLICLSLLPLLLLIIAASGLNTVMYNGTTYQVFPTNLNYMATFHRYLTATNLTLTTPATNSVLRTMAAGAVGAVTLGPNLNLANDGTLTSGAVSSINAQTGTSYSLQASDAGKIVTCNNASAVTVTVPSGLGAGFTCTVVQLGAGQVTFLASSTTINSYGSLLSISGQYASASLVAYTADTFILVGNLQ